MSQLQAVSKDEIQAFIDLYEGDAVAAVRSIRDYVGNQRRAEITKKPSPTTPVLLHVEAVKKTYKVGKTKVNALQGVTLDIHEGEFVAITGASGSGKSTLLQLLGGLDQPSEGVIQIAGTNLRKLSDAKLSRFRGQTIGFVFQFFYLQPFLRLDRNLEVAGMFAGVRRAERKVRVATLAEQVGLSDRLRHYPKELSGGQMQRAAIARALLNAPKVILADEPTGNLDSENSRAIIDLFQAIRREFGTTIVIVTHDQVIARQADREIIMKDGKIL
jgi:ABC-type lipoprotein export system ATPase subunit